MNSLCLYSWSLSCLRCGLTDMDLMLLGRTNFEGFRRLLVQRAKDAIGLSSIEISIWGVQ